MDLKSREHVTKLNFIEIEQDGNDYINSNGEIVLPIANLFEEKAYARFFGEDKDKRITYREDINELEDRDELRIIASVKDKQSEKLLRVEEASYFYRLHNFVFEYMWNGLDWHNGMGEEIKTYRKVLMRIVVVLLLILLSPFVIVVTSTLYAIYRLNLKIQLSPYKTPMSLKKIINAKENISPKQYEPQEKAKSNLIGNDGPL